MKVITFNLTLDALFFVFLVLKLAGIVDWSWWWVTAPVWAPFAFLGIVLVFGSLGFLLLNAFAEITGGWMRTSFESKELTGE